MTSQELSDLLDRARFGDYLHITRANGDHTLHARISGPVLAADDDKAVGIDTLDGEPHIVRTTNGVIYGDIIDARLLVRGAIMPRRAAR